MPYLPLARTPTTHRTRSVVISLKKKTAEWWDTLTKEWKTYKKFCKTDFSKWCEEDDKEYTGELPGVDGMDGMDFGGMGGMGGGMVCRAACTPSFCTGDLRTCRPAFRSRR